MNAPGYSIGNVKGSLQIRAAHQVGFAYRDKCLYVLSTPGQKIEWMRENPNVCVSTDEIVGHSEWTSVIVNGTYRKLVEPRYHEERELAHKLLERHSGWWETPLAERQTKVGDKLIDSIYFRVEISWASSLRAQRKVTWFLANPWLSVHQFPR